ncbi:MAG: hypothetical protein H0W88_00965 [Parachlamydiaceae bacterium]|nr:hypothetical protein [Parachlamydiaceae bacterium]
MKKFIATLILSFACFQSVDARPSLLNETILEYQAILDSPKIQNKIGQNEAIFDIKRTTKNLEANTIFYVIVTREVLLEDNSDFSAENDLLMDFDARCKKKKHHDSDTKIRSYEVKVVLTPNPQIGPDVITVVSIKQISNR